MNLTHLEIEKKQVNSTSTVEIREVKSKKDLKKFVGYPSVLYKDCENYVPAFFGDDMDDWNKKKNPAFEYCEAKCFLAWRDGEIVGRIGAILSHEANKKWDTNRMRFSQVDFIDDDEVSSALFGAVEAWAREKGCEEVHGPLGFCDLDREGMLVEGYDQMSMYITYYNHPYYNEHLERLGYAKDVDWIEYKLYIPDKDSKNAELIHRIAERMKKRMDLHVAPLKKRKDYANYIRKVFELVNKAYAPLYGVVALNERQINRYAKKFIPVINPEFACFVMDKDENMVAFGVSAPSMAKALKKCNGKLFPFGFINVLRALKQYETLDLYLIAVDPQYQKLGLNAIVIDYMIENGHKVGVKCAETGPQLEKNIKILDQWKLFEKDQHKRRRCYLKKI